MLEAWKDFESVHGTEETRKDVATKMPSKVKKRRKAVAADGVSCFFFCFFVFFAFFVVFVVVVLVLFCFFVVIVFVVVVVVALSWPQPNQVCIAKFTDALLPPSLL